MKNRLIPASLLLLLAMARLSTLKPAHGPIQAPPMPPVSKDAIVSGSASSEIWRPGLAWDAETGTICRVYEVELTSGCLNAASDPMICVTGLEYRLAPDQLPVPGQVRIYAVGAEGTELIKVVDFTEATN